MIAAKILWAINMCFQIYFWMICVRCLLTWLPNLDWDTPLLSALKSSVDLYLKPFRKIIPLIGPFDFSPIAAMFVLIFIWQLTIRGFALLFGVLGLLG
jgi:YggT family protein